MPIQITSTTSSKKHIGGVLEEWKALVQRESQMAYRLTGMEVEADRMALSSSPGEQDVVIGRACALALWREKIVEWCYRIIDNW